MKNLIAVAFAVMFVSSTAHAAAYPAYTKDKSAWWVSVILLPPVLALDGVGRAIDQTGKSGGSMKPLNNATKGIAKHAFEGLCGSAVVVNPCK